jgi:hypothetical protein
MSHISPKLTAFCVLQSAQCIVQAGRRQKWRWVSYILCVVKFAKPAWPLCYTHLCMGWRAAFLRQTSVSVRFHIAFGFLCCGRLCIACTLRGAMAPHVGVSSVE